MRKLLSLILFFAVSFSVSAQDFLPEQPVGMVNDFADILTPSEENRLEQKLVNYRDTTTNVIAIVTLESLEGYPEEEIATTLFNNWRMWEGERYNGVLILVSEQDRRMQIEVGYGLEGAIPDIMANRVYADILVPNFQAGDFYAGLDQATNVLIDLAAGEFERFPENSGQSSGEGFPIDVLIIFVIIIFILITRGKGGKGGRRHSLGSSGIIFYGGGGGGSFGGGGGGFGGFSGGGGFGSGGGGAGGGW